MRRLARGCVNWDLIHPNDISAVILTHYPHDHTGGPAPLKANCRVSRRLAGVQSIERQNDGVPRVTMADLVPSEPIDFEGPPVGSFPSSHPITKDERIFMIPAPGHYVGHSAVVARAEAITFLFSGDAGYTLEDMLAGRTDGVTNNPAHSLETIQKSREFARLEPTIVLPAHHPDAPRRLKENEIVP